VGARGFHHGVLSIALVRIFTVMAPLQFSVDPLSFHLPTQHHSIVGDFKLVLRDKLFILFGLEVSVGTKARRAYKDKDVHKAHFRQFASEFQAWAEKFPSSQLRSASVPGTSISGEVAFQRRGVYNENGTYLRPLSDGDGPKLFVVVESQSKDTFSARSPDPNDKQTGTFSQRARDSGLGGTGSPPGASSSAAQDSGFHPGFGDDNRPGSFFRPGSATAGGSFGGRTDKSGAFFGTGGNGKQAFSGGTTTTPGGTEKTSSTGPGESAGFTGSGSGSYKNPGGMDGASDAAGASGGENATAAMDENQAKTVTDEAEAFRPQRPMVTRYAKFDLGAKQRPKNSTEQHVPVARGDYSAVGKQIVRGGSGGYVITGPTGCGKSTVALLPLFSGDATVLVVEPTQANAANIFHEFRNVLPTLYKTGKIFHPVPEVQFVAPTVTLTPYCRLAVTTTDKLIEYFEHYGKLPKTTYLVLDEFHLPIQAMVFCVELLRTFDLVDKYVLVSATAVGFKVHPQLPKAVTAVEGEVPLGRIPERIASSDLDPRRWARRGDGTVAVVAPSLSDARKLHSIYKSWGLRAFLITRETSVTDYVRAAANYQPKTVFVIEPAVEAGITLSMAVLVSMGCTTAVRYDGRVVVEDTQPLGALDAIQRGSRGGRVIPTLYVMPRASKSPPPTSSADYYRARSVIKLVAAGASPSTISDRGLFKVFPKLEHLTRPLALSSMDVGNDPFISIYKRNRDGALYVECGGSGAGFQELAQKELYLYHWSGGFLVAPIVDLSDLTSKPDEFVLRASQLSAAASIVSALGLKDRFSLEDLVSMVIAKFSVYVGDVFLALKKVFSGSSPQKFSLSGGDKEYPEIRHFLPAQPGLLKLFDYMQTEPAGVKYKWDKSESGGTKYSEHSFQYGKNALNFSFPDGYSVKGILDTDRVSREVYELLEGLLAVEILLNAAPDRCVDLGAYRGRVDNEHAWFKKHVVGA